MNKIGVSVQTLAYIGDAEYELRIRKYSAKKHLKIKEIQKNTIEYVSALGQEKTLRKLLERKILTGDEEKFITWARNSKHITCSKKIDIVTYKKATALEALIGYYVFKNNINRINEIFIEILGE